MLGEKGGRFFQQARRTGWAQLLRWVRALNKNGVACWVPHRRASPSLCLKTPAPTLLHTFSRSIFLGSRSGYSLFICTQKFLHFSAVAFNIIYFNYMVSLSFSNRSFMRGALMLPSSQLCPGFLTQPTVAASNKYLLHINVSVNERMNSIRDLNLLTVKWERKTRKKTVNHYDCA